MTAQDFQALTATVLQTMPDLWELAALAMNHFEVVHQTTYNRRYDAEKTKATRRVAEVFGEADLSLCVRGAIQIQKNDHEKGQLFHLEDTFSFPELPLPKS